MKRVRILSVDINVDNCTPGDIEDRLNKEFLLLEKNGSCIINVVSCGNKGFLILHEESFDIMP